MGVCHQSITSTREVLRVAPERLPPLRGPFDVGIRCSCVVLGDAEHRATCGHVGVCRGDIRSARNG